MQQCGQPGPSVVAKRALFLGAFWACSSSRPIRVLGASYPQGAEVRLNDAVNITFNYARRWGIVPRLAPAKLGRDGSTQSLQNTRPAASTAAVKSASSVFIRARKRPSDDVCDARRGDPRQAACGCGLQTVNGLVGLRRRNGRICDACPLRLTHALGVAHLLSAPAAPYIADHGGVANRPGNFELARAR